MIQFNKPFLIYIPAYQCADTILKTIGEIPAAVWDQAEVLVLDNHSSDGTSDLVIKARAENKFPGTVHVIRAGENLGYSGSQKLAYHLAVSSGVVQWVIMLHGDGQYPPVFTEKFIEAANEKTPLIYGVRSKRLFGKKEETPYDTFFFIKALSLLESICTGYWRKEWHSGYVMYHRSFLKNVGLSNLTKTMHIDGHMLFRSGQMGIKIKPLYIYKRYKALDAFEGMARIIYVFNVLKLMVQFRFQKLPVTPPADPDYPYQIL